MKWTFRTAACRMPMLLEVLMRTYTGIFSYAVPIDEGFVAAKCDVSVSELRQLLYGLSVNHVIRYIPTTHCNVIYILHDRLYPGNVQLSPQRYELLKSTFGSRVDTMVDYVQEVDECRTRFLLRYFGEEKADDCGHCDLCRAGRDEGYLRERLLEIVSGLGDGYTLLQVRAALGPAGDQWKSVLRELVDSGELPPPAVE